MALQNVIVPVLLAEKSQIYIFSPTLSCPLQANAWNIQSHTHAFSSRICLSKFNGPGVCSIQSHSPDIVSQQSFSWGKHSVCQCYLFHLVQSNLCTIYHNFYFFHTRCCLCCYVPQLIKLFSSSSYIFSPPLLIYLDY